MSSISNISSVSKVSYLQPKPDMKKAAGGDADGDNDGGAGAGKVNKSNFMNAIAQALGQTLTAGSTTSAATSVVKQATAATAPSNATQDPQAALQTFLHNLMSALHQSDGQAATSADAGSPPAPATGARPREGLSANIQNVLQQLASNNQGAPIDSQKSEALDNLKSSYQNLINVVKSAPQGQASSATNLQLFLQNLLQDLNGGQNISGAVINTTA